MRIGNINQVMLINNQFFVGCEFLFLFVLVVLFLVILFIGFDVDFGKVILVIVFFFVNYLVFKSVVKYDLYFFCLIWLFIKWGFVFKIMLVFIGEIIGFIYVQIDIFDIKMV